MNINRRLASRFLEAEWERVAKPLYLKALDFTIGLVRKFDSRGQQISGDVDNRTMMRRLIQMRKAVQSGFDLSYLVLNDDIMSAAGYKIVQAIEAGERKEDSLLPNERDLLAFMKEFPDREQTARQEQAAFFRGLIARELGLSREEAAPAALDQRVMTDRDFFSKAFAVVNQYVVARKNMISGRLSEAPGKFQIRDKEEQSTWDKSSKRKKVPFYLLGDLLGCRSITTTIPDMAAACRASQASLEVLAKDNKYLDTVGGYNAVHYSLRQDALVVEYQVKATVSFIEAALSHELIYSDDKFRDKFKLEPLPNNEKEMVRRVIDISTQLSMRDWKKHFEIPLMTMGEPMEETLYGDELSEDQLRERLHMARIAGMARVASFLRNANLHSLQQVAKHYERTYGLSTSISPEGSFGGPELMVWEDGDEPYGASMSIEYPSEEYDDPGVVQVHISQGRQTYGTSLWQPSVNELIRETEKMLRKESDLLPKQRGRIGQAAEMWARRVGPAMWVIAKGDRRNMLYYVGKAAPSWSPHVSDATDNGQVWDSQWEAEQVMKAL